MSKRQNRVPSKWETKTRRFKGGRRRKKEKDAKRVRGIEPNRASNNSAALTMGIKQMKRFLIIGAIVAALGFGTHNGVQRLYESFGTDLNPNASAVARETDANDDRENATNVFDDVKRVAASLRPVAKQTANDQSN